MAVNILFVFCLIAGIVQARDWGYEGDNGPDTWAADYPTCGMDEQSPVDIVTADAMNQDLGIFKLVGFMENDIPDGVNIQMENNGHTVLIHIDSGDYWISGADLPGTFKGQYFHFHWGSDDTKGSEHEFNGEHRTAEFHLVTYNKEKYGSYTSALNETDGVAVLGFFLEVGDNNTAFDVFLDKHNDVSYMGQTYDFDEPFAILPLFPADITRFYRYLGSTTTPPCVQNVIWTMFEDPVKVSEEQMNEFRVLYETAVDVSPPVTLVDNFRGIQPLNSRTITYSAPGVDVSSASFAVSNAWLWVAIVGLLSGLF